MTTMVAVEVLGNEIRSYHVGDSSMLLLSSRGRIKHQTVGHSPIEFAISSGIISEREGLMHDDRHLVSNMVGSKGMYIEVSSWIKMSPQDTVVVGSDGLFDNLLSDQITELVRKGDFNKSFGELIQVCQNTMQLDRSEMPSKMDDLTVIGFRSK